MDYGYTYLGDFIWLYTVGILPGIESIESLISSFYKKIFLLWLEFWNFETFGVKAESIFMYFIGFYLGVEKPG